MTEAPQKITAEELRRIKLADAERTMRESYPAWPGKENPLKDESLEGFFEYGGLLAVALMFAAPLLTLNPLLNKDSALERSTSSYSTPSYISQNR